MSGFLRQLAHTAVFDRISLPFIVRVVPSKYASLIGLPFIFCVKIVAYLISAAIWIKEVSIGTHTPAARAMMGGEWRFGDVRKRSNRWVVLRKI